MGLFQKAFLNTAKLTTRSKRKQKGGENGLMMIAIMHVIISYINIKNMAHLSILNILLHSSHLC